MGMNWTELPGPILRKIGSKDDTVELQTVPAAQPGDLDLSEIRMWRTEHSGYSYIISFDPIFDCYGASARPLNVPRVLVDSPEDPTIWLTDRDHGVATFAEAERRCRDHMRGRRDG